MNPIIASYFDEIEMRLKLVFDVPNAMTILTTIEEQMLGRG